MALHITKRTISITKRFSFEAAHHLPYHDGKCRSVHGHNYKLEVEIEGEEAKSGPQTGMVIDFGLLSKIVEDTILFRHDHANLNNIYTNPTAENIAHDIVSSLGPEIRKISEEEGRFIQLKKIRLYETDNCWVDLEIKYISLQEVKADAIKGE